MRVGNASGAVTCGTVSAETSFQSERAATAASRVSRALARLIPLTSVLLSGCEHFRRRAISTDSRSLTLRVEQNRLCSTRRVKLR